MKTYQVEIVEKIVFQVSVEAANEAQAEKMQEANTTKVSWKVMVKRKA